MRSGELVTEEPVKLHKRGEATSPTGEEWEISAFYERDAHLNESAEVAVRKKKRGDKQGNWVNSILNEGDLGSDDETRGSSLDEVVDTCRKKIESGIIPEDNFM